MEAKAMEHLQELRKRLVIIVFYFILFFGAGIIISPYVIRKITHDLVSNIPLVALSPLEFIYTQINVGFVFSIFLLFPVIIFQAIRFIRPGLKRSEISAVKFILPGFILLFLGGIAFAYFIFLKIALYFLASLASNANIENIWSIQRFISFIIGVCLASGLLFELPLVMIVLKKLNIINTKLLVKYRFYIYTAAFIIAAIITPPDIITQILVALPLIILFEISYLLV